MGETKRLTESLIDHINKDEWIVGSEVAVRGTNGRIDVCAVRKRQYLRKQIRAYEVKISRTDFLADVGAQKWRKYLACCHQVYFATPSGLISKSDLPAGAGLITFGAKGWQVARAAPIHEPTDLDSDAVLSILFSVTRQADQTRDRLARLAAKNKMDFIEVSREIGGEVGRRLAGLSPQAEKRTERIIREVEKLFGPDQDVIQSLRFAARISPEKEIIKRIGSFLSGLPDGFYREAPSELGRSIADLTEPEERVETEAPLERHASMDKKEKLKTPKIRSKKDRKGNTPGLFGFMS